MCSPNTRDIIKRVVAGKVKSGEAFSAWDITCELRKEFGISPSQERHPDIKRVVHEAFGNGEMGAFKRTPVNFSGSEAWVYHPADVDPQTRQKISGATAVAVADDDDDDSVATGNAIVGTNSTSTSTNTPTSVAKNLNSDANTIYVPCSQVEALGLDVGDAAFVRVDGNSIKVSDIATTTDDNEIHVDLNGNLRVHTSYLALAGINGRSVTISFVKGAGLGWKDEIVITGN